MYYIAVLFFMKLHISRAKLSSFIDVFHFYSSPGLPTPQLPETEMSNLH